MHCGMEPGDAHPCTSSLLQPSAQPVSPADLASMPAQACHSAADAGSSDARETRDVGGDVLPDGGAAGTEPVSPRSTGASSSGARARRIPQAMVVLTQVEVPSGTPPGTPVVELLQRLMPEHCASATAAKRALRRRLILRVSRPSDATPPAPGPQRGAAAEPPGWVPVGGASGDKPHPRGVQLSVLDTASPHDVLQLLARCGTGFMGWVGPERTDEAARSSAPGAAAGGAGAAGGAAGDAARDSEPWQRRRRRGRDWQRQAGGAAGDGSELGAAAGCVEGGGERGGAAEEAGARGVAAGVDTRLLVGLPVAYEDEHLAVVIKPPGIDTQGSGVGSVQGRLKYCLKPTTLIGALNRPQQVHRLDAPTGGLLLVAKTHAALRGLAADLHHRRMSKRYCSLVKGLRNGSGTIDMPLSGKSCVTQFKAVPLPAALRDAAASKAATGEAAAAADESPHGSTFQQPDLPEGDIPSLDVPLAASVRPPPAAAEGVSLPSAVHGCLTKVHLWPHTGRTHQLRKHMAYTGTPMLGDPRYRASRAATDDPGVTKKDDPLPGSAAAGASQGVGVRCSEGPDPGGDLEGSGAESSGTVGENDVPWAPQGPDRAPDAGGDATWEVCQPPVDRPWVLAVAAAAAGAGDAGDVLSDGSPVSLCLWAVELRFRHPISGRNLQVDIAGWADALYDDLLQREAAAEAAVPAAGMAGRRAVTAAVPGAAA